MATVVAAASILLLREQQKLPMSTTHGQQPEAVAQADTENVAHETTVIPSQGDKSIRSSFAR